MRRLVIDEWEKFSKRTVLQEVEGRERLKWRIDRKFLCKCECGKERVVELSSLRRWESLSCWKCYISQDRSVWRSHPIYKARSSMRCRCRDTKNASYKDYWGRGIEVCQRRKYFDNFFEDMSPTRALWLSIDRIDNDWNYSPDNCRRVTFREQARNKRSNVRYKWKCLVEWFEELWLSKSTYKWRRNNGQSIEQSLWFNK